MADNRLGAWSAERGALEQTRLSGRGSDAGAPDPVRFGRAVMQLVARRERLPDAEYDRPAAFVLTPREWLEEAPEGAIRQPLLHTGHHSLTGQIHFVNFALSGRSLAYSGGAADLFATLDAVRAQTFPTLVYSPKSGSSTLSWYPNGISDEENFELWHVSEEQPSCERIAAVIDRVYEKELMTPDQTTKPLDVWKKANDGWAQEDAEARVQQVIRLTLLGAFRHCSIRGEQPGKDGRTDLEIVEDQDRAHDQIVHHAVLELKVLREKGSTGKKYTDKQIAEHMRDGLEQAHSYGDGRNFRERMLCCFDMRATNAGKDVVYAPLTADAIKLGVDLEYWFLYRSSDHWRKCKVAQRLSA
ncbi:hypothetical protein [Burkholderia pseudomallei]|uniref:hypothetical protein n=1 Tax=Burkholderia pseudomallei TaxID=28450 RepID=UPI00117840CF|nr:hypothetical protein [Burkholderia pseudomallei]MBF3522431.1 hypothetical protein [Burkholderia pseudomallei]